MATLALRKRVPSEYLSPRRECSGAQPPVKALPTGTEPAGRRAPCYLELQMHRPNCLRVQHRLPAARQSTTMLARRLDQRAADPLLQLERAYVRRLPRAFNEELASTTALVARKPND